MSRESARVALEEAHEALGTAAALIQRAADALQGPYKPAATMAHSDTLYAQKRVSKIARLLGTAKT